MNWIQRYATAHGQFPTRQQIKSKAREFSSVDGFKGSKGWMDKFLIRNVEVMQGIKARIEELQKNGRLLY